MVLIQGNWVSPCESVLVQRERASSSEEGCGPSGEQICFHRRAKVSENKTVQGDKPGAEACVSSGVSVRLGCIGLPTASCLELKLVLLSAEPWAECSMLINLLDTSARTTLRHLLLGLLPGGLSQDPPWCPSHSACLLCSPCPWARSPPQASPAHSRLSPQESSSLYPLPFGRGGVTIYLNLNTGSG